MTELKPCPFCGGEDLDVHVGVSVGRRHECVTITCNDCVGSIYGGTEERAIEAWNTRAERTCHNLRQHGYNYLECSLCGEKSYQGDKVFDYCPNCGAKVVGE